METKNMKRVNRLTKIVIWAVLILAGVYVANKFFDNFRLRSPVILRSPIERRYKGEKPQEKPQEGASHVQILPKEKKGEIADPAKEAIYIYFGEDKTAYAVARAESGMRCNAVSSTNDFGLYQIHLPLHQWRFDRFGGKWDNCWDSARVAREIFDEQGWRPWVAFTTGAYLAFINSP